MIRLALLALCSAVRASITDCGSAFQVTFLSLTHDPPVRGAPIYLGLLFINIEAAAVTAGSATTDITLNGLPLSPSTKSLCEATACPIPLGANNRSTSTTWPDVGGKITSRLTWADSTTGKTLLCILTQVKVATVASLQKGSCLVSPAAYGVVTYTHSHGSMRGARNI